MSISVIQRRAIDTTGQIGSFYDIHRDYVLQPSATVDKGQTVQLHQSITCDDMYSQPEKSHNILETIKIDDDLRLSIQLDPKLRTGIAALVEHPYPMDENTRFLYYLYADREQQLSDGSKETEKSLEPLTRPDEATHIITAVSFGIEALIVLQLPNDDNMNEKIDGVVITIQEILRGDQDRSILDGEAQNLLENIVDTRVYSNITQLQEMNSLLDICQQLSPQSLRSDMYRPLAYTLQSIRWLYPHIPESCTAYVSLDRSIRDDLEEYLIGLSNAMKRLRHSLNYDISSVHFKYFHKQVDDAQNQWQDLKKSYENEIKRMRDMIVNVRKEVSMVDKEFVQKNQTTLEFNIIQLTQFIKDLKRKEQLINDLKKEHFDYCNVAQCSVSEDDDEQTWEQKLLLGNRYDQIVCSSDVLKEKDQAEWELLCRELADEYKKNPNHRILYADFSYCAFILPKMVVLKSNQTTNSENFAERRKSSKSAIRRDSASSSSVNEDINILLVGESGVGKSTFINAFINYLEFETFEKAERDKPIVLIPVSFLITTGKDFEERTVKFGDSDTVKNENFDHPGQSVTQHCRSYVFELKDSTRTKLRIIDTPGFGDTRGIDQDDLNMEHILEYIHRLTHLNAICFLLKPNVSQISSFFQVCMNQLLDFLGPNIGQSIIFCFTNARSTFYTPGDTAPLLRGILQSFPTTTIPFKKKNTFCFDNESFRYLVALRNGITFDNEQEMNEYKTSWSTSVQESNRLTHYICTELHDSHKIGEKQSIKHAQLQIVLMIRPILEAMRNICRNIILLTKDTSNKAIELLPKHLSRPVTVCSLCKEESRRTGKFWIQSYIPHRDADKWQCCSCRTDQHIPMYYKLNYEYSDTSPDMSRRKLQEILKLLYRASTEFAYFLLHVARSSKDDPFWIGLVQMIVEENELCSTQPPHEMNTYLVEDLRKLMSKYEQCINNIEPNENDNKLLLIYEWIKRAGECPMVKVQMDAVRKTQKKLMKLSEHEVPEYQTNA